MRINLRFFSVTLASKHMTKQNIQIIFAHDVYFKVCNVNWIKEHCYTWVNVSAKVSVLVLWQTRHLTRVYPASLPVVAGMDSSTPATLNWIRERKWMG